MSTANTNIQLKKSGVTGNVPASLAYGELALNYADGRLYYKNASGTITYIQSGTSTNSFSTINSNSSLILATTPLDTLSFVAGNNISISTDTINKKITISSTASGGGGSGGSGNSTSYIVSDDVFTGTGSQVNFTLSSTPNDVYSVFVNINGVLQLTSSYTVAGNILTFTEAPSPGATIEVKTTIALTTATLNNVVGFAQSAYDQANAAYTLAQSASANTIVTQGVDAWQNNQIIAVNNFASSAYMQANGAYTNASDANGMAVSAYNQANTATGIAQAAFNSANNVAPQVQPAFNKANAAYDLAQSAYNSSNAVNGFAQSAYNQANTNYNSIVQLQAVDTTQNNNITAVNQFAQAAYDTSNGVNGLAQSAYNQANVTVGVDATQNTRLTTVEYTAQYARDTANNAVANTNILAGVNDTQNSRIVSIETVNFNQNTLISIIQGVDLTQNTQIQGIQGVDLAQNTNITTANNAAWAAFAKANNALANTTGTFAGDLTVTGNIYGLTANTTIVAGSYTTTFDNAGRLTLPGNLVFSDASTQTTAFVGNGADSFARTTANGANGLAQGAYNQANVTIGVDATQNSNISIIQGVDLTQNTRLDGLEGVNVTQNTNITSVNQYAQSAYNKANNDLPLTGGTITGTLLVGQDVYVSGNLYIGGNTTSVSANNITLNDSLIYLADQNPANTVDIGLVGHFVQGKYQHTGVVRNHLNGNWVFFSNVSTEPTTTINFAEANLVYDSITTGGIITPSATINGKDWQTVSDTQNTNTTYVNQYAASAYAQANVTVGVDATQNTNITTANNAAWAAFAAGNTNATNITAVNNYATSAYNQANVTAGGLTTANSNISIIQGVDTWQNTQITYVNQFAAAAYDKANAGISSSNTFITVNSNSTLINASSNTDVLTLLPGNNITFVTDAVNKKITISSTLVPVSVPTLLPTRTTFTAASAQTSIAVAHTTPYVYVSINGVTVDPSEYTANGTHVVLTTALRIGDVVDVTGYQTGTSTVSGIKGDKGDSFTSNTTLYVSDVFATGRVNITNVQLANVYSDFVVYGVNDIIANTSLGNLSLADAVASARYANGVNITQNTNITQVNNFAQSGYNVANNASSNTIITQGVDVWQNTQITTASQLAQSAYDTANTKFNSSGGNITGAVTISGNNSLTVTGNLIVTGTTLTSCTSVFMTNDPMLILGIGNYTSDVADIGFASHYNDGVANAHTGLVRDFTTKEYYFFKGYTPELGANNDVDINHASFATANVNASYVKGNVIGTSVYATGSLGVGTAPSGVLGEIRAANNITSYYTSDRQYKENIIDIPNALDKVDVIGGKLFDWTDSYIDSHGGIDDYFMRKNDFGVIAQDVQEAFPVAVRTKPDGSLAVDYEKLSALAFAAIKELRKEIEELKGKK